ncbi:hypothetical protein FGB62_12g134 [Gracilaria domingensis]|nr:hypothetical protein FGB62_12g134 [Gracilaria domingensis]
MPGQRVRFADHSTATFTSARPRSNVGRFSRFEKAGVLPEILSDVKVALNDLCGNCSRPLYVDGTFDIFNEQSESYCSQNCRWTAMLDTNGSRYRRAKRAAAKKDKPKRRRREPLVLNDEELLAASSNDTESDDDFGGTGGNALFGYYCNFGGGTTLKEKPVVSFNLPLPDSTNVN